MPRSTVSKVDWYFDDFLTGTSEMDSETLGVYTRLLNWFYAKQGMLKDDDQWLAAMCRMSTRRYKAVKKRLINDGKISVTVKDNTKYLVNYRAENMLNEAETRKDKYSEKSAKAAKKRWENSEETAENSQSSDAPSIAPSNASGSPPSNASRARSSTTTSTTTFLSSDKSLLVDGGFCGEVIRLSGSDFRAWETNFSALPDLRAELQARDDYLKHQPSHDQKRWFMSTSAYLKNKNSQAVREAATDQRVYATGYQG